MLQSGNTRGMLLCVVTGAIPHQETKKIDSFAILLLNALDLRYKNNKTDGDLSK